MDGILLYSGPINAPSDDSNHIKYSDFLYAGLEQGQLVVRQLNGHTPVNISLSGQTPLNVRFLVVLSAFIGLKIVLSRQINF